MPLPSEVNVVVTCAELVPPARLRSLLELPTHCVLSVSYDVPQFAINCDYWVWDQGLVVYSLSGVHPISKDLYLFGNYTTENLVRYLAFAKSFPWKRLEPQDNVVIEALKAQKKDDPLAVELAARRWSDTPLSTLLEPS